MVTLGVVAQFKLLLSLVISHFLFGETNWNFRQSSGALLLFCGGVFYAWVKNRGKGSRIDEAQLIGEEPTVGVK
jgi:hypothetical protein